MVWDCFSTFRQGCVDQGTEWQDSVPQYLAQWRHGQAWAHQASWMTTIMNSQTPHAKHGIHWLIWLTGIRCKTNRGSSSEYPQSKAFDASCTRIISPSVLYSTRFRAFDRESNGWQPFLQWSRFLTSDIWPAWKTSYYVPALNDFSKWSENTCGTWVKIAVIKWSNVSLSGRKHVIVAYWVGRCGFWAPINTVVWWWPSGIMACPMRDLRLLQRVHNSMWLTEFSLWVMDPLINISNYYLKGEVCSKFI